MRRTPLFRALAAACASAALFSGCGGSPDAAGGAQQRRDTTNKAQTATLSAETDQSASVVFHITGLMLVVPTHGGRTHVLMPKVTRHPDPHVARFAFGLSEADRDLCRPYRNGVCWVDLKDWRMEPIGAGGQPKASRPFPDTIVNVTRATGNRHRVKLDTPEQELEAQLRFEAGTLRGTPCSLARWRYKPVGQTDSVTTPFANVIQWEIRHPRAEPPTLRFIRRSDSLRKSVRLGTTLSGRVHVLLAHVPEKELPFLETGQSTSGPDDKEPLQHLYDLYKHLRDQAAQQATNPPIPVFAGHIQDSCDVTITPFTREKRLVPLAFDGVKTYGCVVGTGGG